MLTSECISELFFDNSLYVDDASPSTGLEVVSGSAEPSAPVNPSALALPSVNVLLDDLKDEST